MYSTQQRGKSKHNRTAKFQISGEHAQAYSKWQISNYISRYNLTSEKLTVPFRRFHHGSIWLIGIIIAVTLSILHSYVFDRSPTNNRRATNREKYFSAASFDSEEKEKMKDACCKEIHDFVRQCISIVLIRYNTSSTWINFSILIRRLLA